MSHSLIGYCHLRVPMDPIDHALTAFCANVLRERESCRAVLLGDVTLKLPHSYELYKLLAGVGVLPDGCSYSFSATGVVRNHWGNSSLSGISHGEKRGRRTLGTKLKQFADPSFNDVEEDAQGKEGVIGLKDQRKENK